VFGGAKKSRENIGVSMYCKECGYQIIDGWKFCENCGKSQGNVEKAEESMLEVKPEENSGWNVVNKIFGFTLLSCLLIIVFYALYLYTSEKSGSSKFFKSTKIAKIVYEVTGTAPAASIMITNAGGGTEMYDVKLPFKYGFRVPIKRSDYDFGYHAYISAQNQGSKGSITVTIYVNEKKFKTSTSNGAYVIAEADGVVEYKDIE
jgi:hypothetical protein